MIELVFAVCMVDEPARCKEVQLNFEAENITIGQCLSYGQMEMAKWAGDHPNWVITKWHCRNAGTVAKI